MHCACANDSILSDDNDGPFEQENAEAIIETTVDLLEVATDSGGRVMARFVVREHSQAEAVLERCTQVTSKRAAAALVTLLHATADDLAEEERRLEATVVFQAAWKGVLQRRRWRKMRGGFVLLQKRFRRRQLAKQLSVGERFQESEERFERELEVLIKRRLSIEEKFRKLKEQPASNLCHLVKFLPEQTKHELAQKHRGSATTDLGKEFSADQKRRDDAAFIIQAGMRQWLIRKQSRRPLWSRSLFQSNLTEAKMRRFQAEIETWRAKHKPPPMTPEEQQELAHKTQLMYASFTKTLKCNRLDDHKALASAAQSHAVLSSLEAAPALNDYKHAQWAQYHSLPLPVATKARLEHKEAMLNLDKPKWKKILDEFG